MNDCDVWQALENLDFMFATLNSYEVIDGEDYDKAMDNLEIISKFIRKIEKEVNDNE